MTYGVFNLASGNLIDSLDSEPEVLALLVSIFEDREVDPETLGLVVADDVGRTLVSLHGRALADAVHSGGIPQGIYA